MKSVTGRVIRQYNKAFTKSTLQLVSNAVARSQQPRTLTTGDKDNEECETVELSPAQAPYQTTKTTRSFTKKEQVDTRSEKAKAREQLLKVRAENNVVFKDYLDSLPELKHPEYYTVECIHNPDEANQKILEITEKEDHFGVDLEWQPSFKKGQSENKTALVQICTSDKIILIQLSRMQGVPSELQKFFENRKIFKTGVNIKGDGQKLYRDFGFLTNGLVDLRDMLDPSMSPKLAMSHTRTLRALTGIFLDQNMYKGKVRLSNWAKAELSPLQIKYAALDAYASYRLYEVLTELQQQKKPLPVRHLGDNPPAAPQKQANEVPKGKNALNNRSTPTSTVVIIKRKQ